MKQKKNMSKEQRRSEILLYIQENQVVSRQELADRFHISLNTLCVDLNSLQNLGIPLDMRHAAEL